jgi:hypothetical protein
MENQLERASHARIARMESKLANRSKQALLEANRRLTAEQRLASYVVHCRLMMDLYTAGKRVREARTQTRS